MGSSVPTAAPDHGPLPGADRGQGVGAAGPGEVRHCRHRFLLQSVEGEDVHTVAWRLNSPFYLKVTCVSRGLNHSLTRSLRHLWKKNKRVTQEQPSPTGLEKISVFHRTMGIMGAVKAKVVEVNLAELADQIEHLPSLCVMEFSRCDQRLRGN